MKQLALFDEIDSRELSLREQIELLGLLSEGDECRRRSQAWRDRRRAIDSVREEHRAHERAEATATR